MRYIPSGDKAKADMLKAVGVDEINELFSTIPTDLQFKGKLNLRPAISEFNLQRELKAKQATYPTEALSFLGGGVYRRFIPAAISPVVHRAEFLTSYTPYQPEVSQGTLQAMFEFQTLMAELTGMDVANGSMYEGATATAEAVFMAKRILPKRKRVIVSKGLHPEYRETLRTYLHHQGLEIVEIPLQANGQTDYHALQAALDENSLCSLLQVVNFYGVIEDQRQHQELVEEAGAVNIAVVVEMTSLGMIQPPGSFNVDIVTGEAQSLGLPLSFGGPNLGVFACKEKYVRKMPGRLSGQTLDVDGKRAFCLTLSTREQHIRREKATSNICSNQQLNALWVSMYVSLLGRQGIHELALMNYSKAREAIKQLTAISGVTLRHEAPHYNEFVLDLAKPALEVWEALDQKGILAGVPLVWHDQADTRGILVNVTEVNPMEEITAFAKALQEVL